MYSLNNYNRDINYSPYNAEKKERFETFCKSREYKGTLSELPDLTKNINLSDPNVWGKFYWFGLHNGAAHYPISASPIVNHRMSESIKSIPYTLPCEKCKIHAIKYINNVKNLQDVCSGRYKLFSFFVDFHNDVNSKTGKPFVSLEKVIDMYNASF
jgi:hypothetical protein